MALLVRPGLQRELGRMFAALGSYAGVRLDVCDSEADALDWIRGR